MELVELRKILDKATKSFHGFGPLGIYAGLNEEYESSILEAEIISASNIAEIIQAYLKAIQEGEHFTEPEHIWLLENIAIHNEILDKFGAQDIKTLCSHYLRSVQSHTSSRIFCIMLLLLLDQFMNDKQSFVMFIFNQAKDVDNERLTQRETLLDLTDVLIDLDAIKSQAKALRILMLLSERSGLSYVTDRVLDLALAYGDEVIQILKDWVGRKQ